MNHAVNLPGCKGVSENSGTPKSSILIGFSIINHPFWGIPIFGNTRKLQENDPCIAALFHESFENSTPSRATSSSAIRRSAYPASFPSMGGSRVVPREMEAKLGRNEWFFFLGVLIVCAFFGVSEG